MATEKAKLKAARQEMTNMVKETEKLTKAMGETSKEMQKMAREFSDGMSQMQQDMRKLREETQKLDKVTAKPKIEFSQVIGKLADVKGELMAIGGLITGLAIGTTISGAIGEAKAAARERAVYKAKGKTDEEMNKFDELTKRITMLNPYLTEPQAMSLISKSEHVNPRYAAKYAEKAAMLNVSNGLSPEDNLKLMTSISAATNIEDPTRLANAVQYMSIHGGGNLNGKFVESMLEFSAQSGKFLDSPEKMATMVGEIGKLGIWNDDKALTALRESTLKFTSEGDLTNLLKTQYEAQKYKPADAKRMAEEEAKKISQALSSGNKDEERVALGKMMMSVAAIEDKAVQRKVLQNLGGNAGKDLEEDFSKILEAAGKIATGEIRPQVGNEAQKAYEAATSGNENFKTMQAQVTAKNEAIEAINAVSGELSGLSIGVANVATELIGDFNNLSESTKRTVIYIGSAFAIGVPILIGLTKLTAATIGFIDSAKEWLLSKRKKMVKADTGGSDPTSSESKASENSTLTRKNNDVGTGRKKCCCCCDDKPDGTGNKRQKPSFKYRTKSKNKSSAPAPATSPSGNKTGPDTGGAQGEASKANGKRRNASPTASTAGHTPDTLIGGSQRETAKTEEKSKNSSPATSPAGNQAGSDSGGNLAETGKAASRGGWKSMLKGGLRRVPLLGTLLGVTAIAGSENKLDTAAQVGAEALGGWGGAAVGAATGAAIGSVLPGIGTAIGGVVGGVIGGMGGSFAGGALYDGIKSWWQGKTPAQTATMQPPIPAGPPIPNLSPVSNDPVKSQPVSITIPQISIPLHVQGMLQDIPTMLKMLNDPSVAQRIKDIIERSLLDALETRGGVTT